MKQLKVNSKEYFTHSMYPKSENETGGVQVVGLTRYTCVGYLFVDEDGNQVIAPNRVMWRHKDRSLSSFGHIGSPEVPEIAISRVFMKGVL